MRGKTNGKRIKFFRKRSGLTLKRLGELVGFSASTAEVRINQYEYNLRSPQSPLLEKISAVLNVAPQALTVPIMDNAINIIHILFVLEDEAGLEIYNDHGTITLRFNGPTTKMAEELSKLLMDWSAMRQMVKQGQLTHCDYDTWRYQLGH